MTLTALSSDTPTFVRAGPGPHAGAQVAMVRTRELALAGLGTLRLEIFDNVAAKAACRNLKARAAGVS